MSNFFRAATSIASITALNTVATKTKHKQLKHTDQLCVETTSSDKEHQIVHLPKDDVLLTNNHRSSMEPLH